MKALALHVFGLGRSTSRETRDTLFMLLVIGWTIAPHVLRLPAWVGLLCGVVLLWRGSLAMRQAPLPGRWWLVGTLALAAALTFWSERTLIGKDAGVTLLVVLMALKTLELRARRDALVVFFLGFFLVLTQFLYSQTLWTALAMGLSVWGWLTALTLAHMPAGRPRLWEAAGLAGRAALVGTPVMIALFLLFPRIGPLWGMPGASARTGLSDNLQLGDVAELANDESIAFRLRFEGQPPPAEQLYFRGPVLSDYDGREWRVDSFTPPSAGDARSATVPRYRYEMTLEPLRIHWLPLLEGTRETPQANPPINGMPLQPDASGQWRLRRPLGERVILSATADLQTPSAAVLRPFERRTLTFLPAGRHLRTRAWARELRSQAALADADATALATAVQRHIRTQPYVYTLEPGTYEIDAVDEFWLDRREGFCEHYAASFVVIMRAMGVPARIVTGYQGTDFLPVDGYFIVRQSHAHAWAEYWQAGRGWVRADPTAAVAPERIRRSEALQAPPGFIAGAFAAVNPDLRLRLRNFVEALDNRWNQWILGYGRREQFDLLGQLGMKSPDMLSLVRVLVGLVVLAGLVGAIWAWLDARRQSPWQKLRNGIARELARLGIEAKPSDTLDSLARRLREQRGAHAEPAVQALHALDLHRYGRPGRDGTPPGWWRDFKKAMAPLKPTPAAPTPLMPRR
jgi:transglutaminase-like putative cysteine protease